MRIVLAVFTLSLAVVSRPAHAQSELMSVPPGTRVRLQVVDSLPENSLRPRAQLLHGRLVYVRGDTVALQPFESLAPTLFLRDAVRRAHASRGASRWRSMVLLGLGGGLMAYTTADIIRRDREFNRDVPVARWGSSG
jgi:hypothetical protein